MLGTSSPGYPRPLLIDQQSLIKNDTEEGYSKKIFDQIKLNEETITTVEGTDPQGQGQGNSISSSCLVATGWYDGTSYY